MCEHQTGLGLPPLPGRKMGSGRRISFALSSALALLLTLSAGAQDVEQRQIDEIDLHRIAELFHLTDTFGEAIWPGFDIREIPIAINNDDRQELLIGHPDPPEEFRPFGEHEMNGEPVMIMDGSTRYGPRGGGWAVNLGGAQTAYVSVLQQKQPTEAYLSLLVHECFHVYQGRYREVDEGPRGNLPEDDPVYSALIGLESRILHAALTEAEDDDAMRELAEMFVAVRHERREGLGEELIRTEHEQEYNEGTATYAAARVDQLISESEVFRPLEADADPQYSGFANASARYREAVFDILPAPSLPISFFHSMYQHGMAQCFLLDRLRPGWKEEMREQGASQFKLLERELPLDAESESELVAAAKERFDYQRLLEAQTRLVEERVALIRSYVQAEGRRYRIYHGDIQERFRWSPKGPVYEVPEWLMQETDERIGTARIGDPNAEDANEVTIVGGRATLWVGGIQPLERGELRFESGDVPVLFRYDFLEWVDTDPDPEFADLHIEADEIEDDVFRGLTLTTDGFILKMPMARVHQTEGVVAIYPLDE